MNSRGILSYYGQLFKESGYSFAKGLALPFVRPSAVKRGGHAMIYPRNTFSPWIVDEEFKRIWRTAQKYTLDDVTVCYELWDLVKQVSEVPGAIVEVGVWRGGTGAIMARQAELHGITDSVYLCDTWEGVVKTGENDPFYKNGKHDDASEAIVRELVERENLTHVKLLKGTFPDETADQVTDKKLRLLHIDVDVYESAADVLDWGWPMLSQGGVVVFDDYGCAATPGVNRLVKERDNVGDRFFFHNVNGHGVFVKR